MTAVAYLEQAKEVLHKYGLIGEPKEEDSQLAALLQQAVSVDATKILAIAQTLKYIGSFSQLVRDNVNDMHVSTRYDDITRKFDSIREDAANLVHQLDDGKIDRKERMQNLWMRLARGTIKGRFEDIQKLYLEVSKDVRQQLESEDAILDGYMDFRFALKQAEGLSYEVLKEQKANVDSLQKTFAEANNAVSQYTAEDMAVRSGLELKRDETQRVLEAAIKVEQLLKDVAENLTMSYNVGQTLIEKLNETHDVKKRGFDRAVTFMTTNEQVFTTLSAVFTSSLGLHEAAETQEAMVDGINKSIETIAELSHDIEKKALRAGYGSTYRVESVRKLVDSITSFQTESQDLIRKYKKEAEDSAIEIEKIVNDGAEQRRHSRFKFLEIAA